MLSNSGFNTRIIALLIFSVFSIFLLWASSIIPNGAGPDEGHSINTIRFYQTFKRLPLFPQDAQNIKFSVYGSTRLTRPPFPYMASALSATLNPPTKQAFGIYRYPSALMVALSIVVIFLTLVRFGIDMRLAAIASVLVGSIPQYLFHGVYISDDAGAFLATSLQFASALALIKSGITKNWIIFTAAVVGFTFVNKITGWIGLPPLFLLFLIELWQSKNYENLLNTRVVATALIAFFIAGGYWIIYNIVHYGNDPFLMKLSKELGQEFARIKTPNDRGYGARFDMGLVDVAVDWEFITASFRAFIGNLDQIRLPVGPVSYIWFGLIFFMGFAGFINSVKKLPTLAAYAIFWIALQYFMYVFFNVREDVQIQGKYMLPIVPIIAFYFAIGLKPILQLGAPDRTFTLASLLIASASVSAVTLSTRVIPFYRPPPIDLYQSEPIDVFKNYRKNFNDSTVHVRYKPNVQIESESNKSEVIFDSKLCQRLGHNFIIEGEFTASQDDEMRISINEGNGFRHRYSFVYRYKKGRQSLWWPIGTHNCHAIRLHPFALPGTKLTNVSLRLIPYNPREQRTYR